MRKTAMGQVVAGLEAAREEAAKEVSAAMAKLAQIDRALNELKTPVLATTAGMRRQDFISLGITEAAKRFLLESGPKTTKEIAGELLARGVRTKSKRYVPTVYATLKNASAVFERKGSQWALKKER
jgi:uncharacterized membrane-anchored protein